MAVASYGSATKTSGVVRIVKDLDLDLTGRDVLVVEDIVDSGLTLSYLRRNLLARNPASLEVCALLVKDGLQRDPTKLAYTGFRIPPDFVVGYGLDVGRAVPQPALCVPVSRRAVTAPEAPSRSPCSLGRAMKKPLRSPIAYVSCWPGSCCCRRSGCSGAGPTSTSCRSTASPQKIDDGRVASATLHDGRIKVTGRLKAPDGTVGDSYEVGYPDRYTADAHPAAARPRGARRHRHAQQAVVLGRRAR